MNTKNSLCLAISFVTRQIRMSREQHSCVNKKIIFLQKNMTKVLSENHLQYALLITY